MRRLVPVLIVCLAAAPAFAEAPVTDAQCEALTRLAMPHASITQATVERSGTFHEEHGPGGKPHDHTDLPPFCRVLGTATPVPDSKIGFEIWLPLGGWSGRLQAIGNGAYDDRIYYAQMAQRVRAGDVVVGDRHRPQGRRPEVRCRPSRGDRRLGRRPRGAREHGGGQAGRDDAVRRGPALFLFRRLLDRRPSGAGRGAALSRRLSTASSPAIRATIAPTSISPSSGTS